MYKMEDESQKVKEVKGRVSCLLKICIFLNNCLLSCKLSSKVLTLLIATLNVQNLFLKKPP